MSIPTQGPCGIATQWRSVDTPSQLTMRMADLSMPALRSQPLPIALMSSHPTSAL